MRCNNMIKAFLEIKYFVLNARHVTLLIENDLFSCSSSLLLITATEEPLRGRR